MLATCKRGLENCTLSSPLESMDLIFASFFPSKLNRDNNATFESSLYSYQNERGIEETLRNADSYGPVDELD